MTVTQAQLRAKAKYRAKAYDRIEIMTRKDGEDGVTREEIDAAAKRLSNLRIEKGEDPLSRTEFILEAIREKIARES